MAIRVVVAGLGPRGRDWVRQLRTRPAFEIVACAELDPEVLARAAGELAIPAEQRFADIVGALSHGHWTDEVFAAPARLENSAVDTSLLGTKFTRQHSLEGFCIIREGTGDGRAEVALQAEGNSIDSRDLSRLIKRLLAVGAVV